MRESALRETNEGGPFSRPAQDWHVRQPLCSADQGITSKEESHAACLLAKCHPPCFARTCSTCMRLLVPPASRKPDVDGWQRPVSTGASVFCFGIDSRSTSEPAGPRLRGHRLVYSPEVRPLGRGLCLINRMQVGISCDAFSFHLLCPEYSEGPSWSMPLQHGRSNGINDTKSERE